jgi:LysR family transcriptional regulator, hydrogen peroxide-inducible genes activator
VRLTEAGRALLPQAMEILRRVHDAHITVESFHHGVGGRLIVGSIPTITPYFLAPRLRQFVASFPDVELRLVEDLTANLVGMLQAGEMDLAVISPPVTNPDVVCSDLFREPIFVAMAANHKLANAPAIQMPDLTGEKLLLLKEGHCFRDNALTVCTRSRANFIAIFESDQFASILPLVSAGVGISLVPEMAADPRSGCKFQRLEKDAHRRIGYIRIRRHSPGTAQKAFIAWLRQIARDELKLPA